MSNPPPSFDTSSSVFGEAKSQQELDLEIRQLEERHRIELENLARSQKEEQARLIHQHRRQRSLRETERQLARPTTHEPFNEQKFLEFQYQYRYHFASAGLYPSPSQARNRASIVSMNAAHPDTGKVDRKYILLVGPPKSGKLSFARGELLFGLAFHKLNFDVFA